MNDYIVRATAADGQVRAFAATTKELVEAAREHHNTSPVATAALGRLLTAGAMMGSMMKNDTDMLTLQVRGDGPLGGITVTADSKGDVKGYVNHPDVMLPPKNGKLDVGGAVGIGLLQVIKDMGLKEPYSGQTILVSSEIAEDLTAAVHYGNGLLSCVLLQLSHIRSWQSAYPIPWHLLPYDAILPEFYEVHLHPPSHHCLQP